MCVCQCEVGVNVGVGVSMQYACVGASIKIKPESKNICQNRQSTGHGNGRESGACDRQDESKHDIGLLKCMPTRIWEWVISSVGRGVRISTVFIHALFVVRIF